MSEKVDTTIIEMSAVNKLEASLLSTGMIVPNISIIKLINCHGGEYRPIVGTTAQRIADRTGMRVAAYDGAVSIYETLPYQANTRIARMFYPH